MGYQSERVKDERSLSAPHRAAKGQTYSLLVEHLELGLGERRPRDVEAELAVAGPEPAKGRERAFRRADDAVGGPWRLC